MAAEEGGTREKRVARPVPDPEPPEVVLAREERFRLPWVVAAVLAGVLPLAAFILAATTGSYPSGENKEAETLRYLADNSGTLLGSAIIQVGGVVASAVALLFLFAATKGRRPETPRVARFFIILGAAALAVGAIGFQMALGSQAHEFVDTAEQTDAVAEDLLKEGNVATFAYVRSLSVLLIIGGFVLTALNAMRAGLLTRFMGILGVIVGLLPLLSVIVPFSGTVPLIQTFWFIGLALLVLGRWPNGVPPAWTEGRAIAWPSQQELRERAELLRAQKRGEEPPARSKPVAEPEPDAEPGSASADADSDAPAARAPQKRKRKRRG